MPIVTPATHTVAGNVMGKKLACLLAVLALAVAGAGCNTVKGAGKDVQKAGKAVERAADKAQLLITMK